MPDHTMTGERLAAVLEPLAAAAMRGQYELLLAEAERAACLIQPQSSAQALVRTGGAWYEAPRLEHGPGERPFALPVDAGHGPAIVRDPSGLFVPVVPGALALWVGCGAGTVIDEGAIALLRQFLALAVQTCERQRIAAQNLDEVQSHQRVATRMLKSHELGEILLLITQEARRLLSADICGVLLLEGNQLVMKRCVGNRAPDTADLHMGPGQGLAGLVLAEGKPASVEDYLASASISRDFFHLAEAELVRSALAAPLMARGHVSGVLEVWRRRPSVFTPHDTMRLVALANLTAIAIENAELYADQRRMVDELGRANAALNERYDTVRSISTLSHNLMQMLLQGATLEVLAGTVWGFLQADVVVVARDGAPIAASATPGALAAMAPALQALSATARQKQELELQGERWCVQPVVVEGDTVAWALARVGGQGQALTELALVQLATLAALQRLEQRAASRARAETIDAIVWDLMRADEATRAVALDRAADLRLDLAGPLRLLLVDLGTIPPGFAERSGSELRQLVQREFAALRRPGVRAITLHGALVAALVAEQGLDELERNAQRLAQRLAEALDGRLVVAGASSTCASARALPTAWREARIALDVGRQVGRTGAVVYDRAGVVGMLLSLRHTAGMQRFLELNLGRLLAEEDKQRDLLLRTLRAFFDANCSHEAASQHLGVHRKTIAHRLARISELTGLDLSTHDDRLVADLSLYVYRLLENEPPAPSAGSDVTSLDD